MTQWTHWPTDIYRTLHSTVTEYTLFSSSHGQLMKTENIPIHKKFLRLKMIEIIQSIYSHQNGIEVEIDNRKIL